MNRLPLILNLLLIAEAIGCAIVVGLRLNSTQPAPRLLKESHDTLTASELTVLPRRFLFDNVRKWRALGEAYLGTGHFSTAEACLRQAVEHDPNSPQLSFLHGLSLERLGQSQAAADAYRRAADSVNANEKSLALYCLGRTFLRLEQPAEAAAAFAEAGDSDSRSVYQRARLLIRDGQSDRARPLVQSLLKSHSTDLHVWRLMEQLAALDGDSEAAAAARDWRDHAQHTLDVDAGMAYTKSIRGRFGLERELESRRKVAKGPGNATLTQLVSEDNNWQNEFPWLLEPAANAELQAKNPKAARALLLRQIEQEDLPTAMALEILGDIENGEDHLKQAGEAWERANRMRPTATLSLKLAALAEMEGDRSLQRRWQGVAGFQRGLELFHENKLTEARSMLQQTTTSANAEVPDLWFTLGEIERLLGNTSKARAAYLQCLKLNPDHGRALTAVERLESH